MKIVSISPNREDVAELLQMSSDYAAGLYPEESNHLDGADELSKPNVYFIGAFDKEKLMGIGAVKIMAVAVAYGEIKRVFVLPAYRSKGVSKMIMVALENHLKENRVMLSMLETGVKQPEALGLYKKLGYIERDPFGSYLPDPLSIFMEKRLRG